MSISLTTWTQLSFQTSLRFHGALRVTGRGSGLLGHLVPGARTQPLLTCGGPGLDVSRAVDHGVLGFPFFHRAEAVPTGRTFVKLLSGPGVTQGSRGAPSLSKLRGSLVCLVTLNLNPLPPTISSPSMWSESPKKILPNSLPHPIPRNPKPGPPGPLTTPQPRALGYLPAEPTTGT